MNKILNVKKENYLQNGILSYRLRDDTLSSLMV